MASKRRPILPIADVDEFSNYFDVFDTNSDKHLDFEELKKVFDAIGWKITDEQLEKEMKKFDIDKNGFIDYKEYQKLIASFKERPDEIPKPVRDENESEETDNGSDKDSNVDTINHINGREEMPSGLTTEQTAPNPIPSSSKRRKINRDIGSQAPKESADAKTQTSISLGNVNIKGICNYCGIQYQDNAMYYIHMGCHTLNAPFTCNFCGENCKDKIQFQIHTDHGHKWQFSN